MRMKLSALVTLLAFPALAFAAGDGAAGSNPFAGDLGNALWTVIIFVIVLIVLGKFAWGPILEGLQKRESFIVDSLAAAKKDREEAEAKLKEYLAQIQGAKDEATAIVDEGRRDAEVVKRRIEEDARAEADRMVDRAKREINIATETALNELYALSAKLATDVASKIIDKELDQSQHERLIGDAIREIQGGSRN